MHDDKMRQMVKSTAQSSIYSMRAVRKTSKVREEKLAKKYTTFIAKRPLPSIAVVHHDGDLNRS